MSDRKEKKATHENRPTPSFRALLLITSITAYLYFLYGQERQPFVPIARNAAWNDLVHQIDPSVDNSAHETLGTQVVLIQKFLREHQSEVNVGVYNIAVFKAIDQLRARLQQADKDLQTIRSASIDNSTPEAAGKDD